MIAEAIDTLITLGWAFAGWLIFFATVASILTLAAIATGAWAARGAWRAVTGPSWRRGPVRAGILARRRVRAPSGHTEPQTYREAA